MASDIEFVRYAAEQMRNAGEIAFRKMFGEYGLYCDGNFFGMICDNQVFVKITEAVKTAYPDLPEAIPYAGAKPHFLLEDIDNAALAAAVTAETCARLPAKKEKSKKRKGQ